MRTKHRRFHFLATAATTLPLMLGSMSALAGRTVIEFAGDAGYPIPFTTSGDAWVTATGASACAGSGAASCGVAFTNGASSSAIALGLGFSANIGGTSYDSVFINSSGLLTFGQAYTAGYSSLITSIANLGAAVGAPVIAADYANLGIGSGTSFAPFGGGASYFRGEAIPNVTSSSTTADLVPAFAATWFSNTSGSDPFNPQVATQVVLYSTSDSGDFDLRFRYGSSDDVTYTGAVAGFSLGEHVESIVNPSSATDYFYRYVGGLFDSGGSSSGGGGGSISVPEMDPASAASGITLLLGAMIVLSSRRRHRSLTA